MLFGECAAGRRVTGGVTWTTVFSSQTLSFSLCFLFTKQWALFPHLSLPPCHFCLGAKPWAKVNLSSCNLRVLGILSPKREHDEDIHVKNKMRWSCIQNCAYVLQGNVLHRFELYFKFHINFILLKSFQNWLLHFGALNKWLAWHPPLSVYPLIFLAGWKWLRIVMSWLSCLGPKNTVSKVKFVRQKWMVKVRF